MLSRPGHSNQTESLADILSMQTRVEARTVPAQHRPITFTTDGDVIQLKFTEGHNMVVNKDRQDYQVVCADCLFYNDGSYFSLSIRDARIEPWMRANLRNIRKVELGEGCFTVTFNPPGVYAPFHVPIRATRVDKDTTKLAGNRSRPPFDPGHRQGIGEILFTMSPIEAENVHMLSSWALREARECGPKGLPDVLDP